MSRRISLPVWSTLLLTLALALPATAQNRVTTPVERFGTSSAPTTN